VTRSPSMPALCGSAVVAVLLVAFAPGLSAASDPSQIVYATDLVTDRILRVDFDHLTTTQVNSAADVQARKLLKGLVVRNDGGGKINLIVADGLCNGGTVLFYPDVEHAPSGGVTGLEITRAVPSPDGVSLDLAGNIYVVSSPLGKKRQVFRILRDGSGPTGYSTVQAIDDNVPSGDLDDTKIDPATGDLLVLSEHPATIFRYKSPATCTPVAGCVASGGRSVFIASAFDCDDPEGMAYAPDGNLLVTTNSGRILRFKPDGTRADPFVFASDSGGGLYKIAVGFQAPVDGPVQNRAFVTQRNARDHNVLAFKIEDNGTGTALPDVSSGFKFPLGVGIGNGKARPTRASDPNNPNDPVTVQLDTFSSTFARINTAGLTDATCSLYPDPRETECAQLTAGCACGPGGTGTCKAGFCSRSLSLSELTSGGLDFTSSIPPYVRSFRKNDPVKGVPTFFVCQTVTTAQFGGTLTGVEEEGEWLKWPFTGSTVEPGNGEPACRDSEGSDRTMQVRGFWAPIPGAEPAIVEGDRFIDISTGCTASNRSNPPDYSLFLPAVRDTRDVKDIVDDKLSQLLATVGDFRSRGFITPSSENGTGDPRFTVPVCGPDPKEKYESMEDELQNAKSKFRKDAAFANCEVQDFLKIVTSNPANFHNTASGETRQVLGELESRAQSALFFLCKLAPKGLGCTGDLRP